MFLFLSFSPSFVLSLFSFLLVLVLVLVLALSSQDTVFLDSAGVLSRCALSGLALFLFLQFVLFL